VAAGHGITTVPGLALPGLPPSLAVARIDDPAAVRRVGVVVRPGAPADEFVERLRDVAAQLAAELRSALQN
jgi:DNA-binding transcriptional LysR family regulator